MKRYSNQFRMQVQTESDWYIPVVTVRRQVVPGTTITGGSIDFRFASSVINRFLLTPVLVQHHMFYVPHRLVWDGWQDFISQALDENTTIPNTAVPWYRVQDIGRGDDTYTVLARRAYKLIYNEYFGQSGVVDYPDITDDANIDDLSTICWDQYTSKATVTDKVEDGAFEAPVTGTDPDQVATINLRQFQRSMRDAVSRRKATTTGDKYIDSLRRMGVELDWRLQMAPEYLGTSQVIVRPMEIQSTVPDTLDDRASQWRHKFKHNFTKKKSFAEHGMIMGIMNARPSFQNVTTQAPVDARQENLDDYYLGDNMTVQDRTSSAAVERFSWLRNGRNTYPGNSLNYTYTGGIVAGGVPYVDTSLYEREADGRSHWSVLSDMNMRELTPVAPNQF